MVVRYDSYGPAFEEDTMATATAATSPNPPSSYAAQTGGTATSTASPPGTDYRSHPSSTVVPSDMAPPPQLPESPSPVSVQRTPSPSVRSGTDGEATHHAREVERIKQMLLSANAEHENVYDKGTAWVQARQAYQEASSASEIDTSGTTLVNAESELRQALLDESNLPATTNRLVQEYRDKWAAGAWSAPDEVTLNAAKSAVDGNLRRRYDSMEDDITSWGTTLGQIHEGRQEEEILDRQPLYR